MKDKNFKENNLIEKLPIRNFILLLASISFYGLAIFSQKKECKENELQQISSNLNHVNYEMDSLKNLKLNYQTNINSANVFGEEIEAWNLELKKLQNKKDSLENLTRN
ncbi:MAG: hypothetical protein WC812_02875 [Candidatus Pacearchaeota archaeon]|jgi:lipopolysaccharide export system protein LptC